VTYAHIRTSPNRALGTLRGLSFVLVIRRIRAARGSSLLLRWTVKRAAGGVVLRYPIALLTSVLLAVAPDLNVWTPKYGPRNPQQPLTAVCCPETPATALAIAACRHEPFSFSK